MTTYLTYSESDLKNENGYWTAKEITQQPIAWRKAADAVSEQQRQIDSWLQPILAKPNLRIILTGAGTSAYVGESIAPHLSHATNELFEAVSTTDIVSNPNQYLLKNRPTLLVSYGRSGNSPESVAAVNLANQVVDDCYHLVITCNAEGELALNARQSQNSYTLLMPEETLDQSFAMTSSFTSMLISTLCIFHPEPDQLEACINWANILLETKLDEIKLAAGQSCQTLVYLGSGPLQGIAQESALKVLELSAGQILSYYESPLGFRHGPKSLVNEHCEIIVYASSDSYTKRYDQDLIAELRTDGQAASITVLDHNWFGQERPLNDVWAGLTYLLYAQVHAFFKAINLNITPDNPCPTGEVNRVVQGVNIYPLALEG